MINLRRKLALMVCPELKNLPPRVGTSSPLSKSPSMEKSAELIRGMDRAYSAHTGVLLNLTNGPACKASIVPIAWKGPIRVRSNAIATLLRLRRNRVCGIHPLTEYCLLMYFSSIWPEDLEWPSDIPRPHPKEEAA